MNILEVYKEVDNEMFKCVIYKFSDKNSYLVRITESKLNLANSYYFKDNNCGEDNPYDYENKFYITSYKGDLGRVLYDGDKLNSIFIYYSPYLSDTEAVENASEVIIPKDLDILLKNDKELNLFLDSINHILNKINESPFEKFISNLKNKYSNLVIKDNYISNSVRLNVYFDNGVCSNVFIINDYTSKQYSSISILCYYEELNDLLVDIIDGFKNFKLTGDWLKNN